MFDVFTIHLFHGIYLRQGYRCSDPSIEYYTALYTSLAVAPMDYSAVSALMMFDSCETRQCIDISIVNDAVRENTESFFVTLVRTPDLDHRITLDPVAGEIDITTDDGLLDVHVIQ